MWLKIFADKPFSSIYMWNRYFYQGRVALSSACLKTAAFPLGLFCKLGIAFVDEKIPNHQQIENDIAEKEEEFIEEAKEKLNQWLAERGLETVMVVVIALAAEKAGTEDRKTGC